MNVLLEQDRIWWEQQAQQLTWFEPWHTLLSGQEPYYTWFEGGMLNASYLCLDVHIKAGRDQQVAIYWEDEQGERRAVTYKELWRMTCYFARWLQDQGVVKGDRVIVYMPMIPEAIAAMLAIARIGAIHVVVFSGFGIDALRERIIDVGARVVMTADFDIRRGKIIPLKDIVDKALAGVDVNHVLVCRRWNDGECSLDDIRDVACWCKNQWALSCDVQDVSPVAVASADPLFILYTSGSTGRPKGIMHSTGGYLTYVYSTIGSAFGIDTSSIYWCTADIGWITGHSYVVYGPLMRGATIVMFDGAPDTPRADIWWELIERYGVSIFYTAPTALRYFMKLGESSLVEHTLASLRVLGSVGEPLNPQVWQWYYRYIGMSRCPIIDTWWQTETGGFMIAPEYVQASRCGEQKPGSVTKPLPGIDAAIVDEHGNVVDAGEKGFVIIQKPWPGMPLGLWKDDVGLYKKNYWDRFAGVYYSGDYAIQDADGDFFMISRADEVLNIAGHRIGTAEIETALLCHASVAEAAAIGIQDEVKGESVVAFIVLRDGFSDDPILRKELIQAVHVRIGKFVSLAYLFFIDELPKTRSGKILRRILKAMVLREPIGDMSTLEDDGVLAHVMMVYQAFLDKHEKKI